MSEVKLTKMDETVAVDVRKLLETQQRIEQIATASEQALRGLHALLSITRQSIDEATREAAGVSGSESAELLKRDEALYILTGKVDDGD